MVKELVSNQKHIKIWDLTINTKKQENMDQDLDQAKIFINNIMLKINIPIINIKILIFTTSLKKICIQILIKKDLINNKENNLKGISM